MSWLKKLFSQMDVTDALIVVGSLSFAGLVVMGFIWTLVATGRP